MSPVSTTSTRLGLLLTFLLTTLILPITAQNTTAIPASSTFTHGGGPSNLSLSLNVPRNSSSDLYFHFNGPATASWLGFGFGSSMSSALMFVVYESLDRKHIIVSPRTTSGHAPPEHTDKVQVYLLPGTGVAGNVMNVNALCSNCRTWASGSLDVTNEEHEMIWAIGPAGRLDSDDVNASIRQHQIQDIFPMNLVKATGNPGVPVPVPVSSGTGDDDSSDPTDNDQGNENGSESDGYGPPKGMKAPPAKVLAHSLLMVGSFLILFPGGYLVLRVFEKVVAHAAVQAVAMVLVIVSTGLGVSISKGMNISPSLTHPHQILGILILILVLATFVVGASGHAVYRKTSQPAKFMIAHRVLGPLTIGLGPINVCVGFHFAGNNRPIIGFVVVSLLMVIFVGGVTFWVRRRRMRKAAMNTPAAMNFREGQQQDRSGEAPPPQYPGGTEQVGGHGHGPGIPLQTYQPKGPTVRTTAHELG